MSDLHIPITWGEKHRHLKYSHDTFKDKIQESTWLESGHCHDALSIELHVVLDPYDWMSYLTNYFDDLDHVSFCFSKFKPGQYFPMHQDRYGFFSKKYGINDPNQVWRYILFLEDSKPGHILQVGEDIYYQWKAGDCVKWQGTTPHLAANLGIEDRYTLQITGIKKIKS